MGMDVYGKDGSYFRANIWSWRAICHAMELAEFEVPDDWHSNMGAGLEHWHDCEKLADLLEAFLKDLDGDEVVLDCETIRVGAAGGFVDPGTPGARSPYCTDREHLEEFVAFLRDCNGFAIH